MANKKISELAAAAALGGTEKVEIVQAGVNVQTTTQDIANLGGGGTSIPFGSTSGTNTYTITATPTITSYTSGMLIHVRIGNSSTGAVTFNFDGVGAKKLLNTAGTQASDGYLKSDVDYIISYNSTLDSGTGAFVVVNEIIHGFMNLRGVYAASGGLYPSGGGSGPSGSVRHGDTWVISGTDTIGSLTVRAGDLLTTAVDNPGQTASNWYWFPGATTIALITTLGTQDLFVSGAAMWPRITSGCAPLTQYAFAACDVNTMDFDQTTQEFCQFQIVMPRKYNNGTVTAVFYWTAISGSGGVTWGIAGGAYSNDDALNVALGTPQFVDDTLLAIHDLHISPETSAITIAGSPADGDFVQFQVSRNPGASGDTLNADAKLLGVVLRITVDAGTDA